MCASIHALTKNERGGGSGVHGRTSPLAKNSGHTTP